MTRSKKWKTVWCPMRKKVGYIFNGFFAFAAKLWFSVQIPVSFWDEVAVLSFSYSVAVQVYISLCHQIFDLFEKFYISTILCANVGIVHLGVGVHGFVLEYHVLNSALKYDPYARKRTLNTNLSLPKTCFAFWENHVTIEPTLTWVRCGDYKTVLTELAMPRSLLSRC